MPSIKTYVLVSLFLSALIGCSKEDNLEEDLQANQIEALLTSPEMLNIDNYLLKVESDIWRDFMPPSDSSGRALTARVLLSERNQRTLDNSLQLEKIYLINKTELWSKSFDTFDNSSPYQVTGTARNGPKWGPNITVDLICEFSFKGESYRLLAKDQEIFATY
jgi:ATP sulfurylase